MQTQSMRLRATASEVETTRRFCKLSDIAGHSIQIFLAIYLLPVLLVMMIVGVLGMAILAICHLIVDLDPTRRVVR
jgi:hypothetical protein